MRSRLCLGLGLAVFTGFGIAACLNAAATDGTQTSTTAALATDDEKSLYTLGMFFARDLERYHLTEAEMKTLERGLDDGVLRRPPKVDFEIRAKELPAFAKRRELEALFEEEKASESFLASVSAETGAQTFASGLVLKETSPGTGDSPKVIDRVRVQYEGKLRDGTVFESSLRWATPAQFVVGAAIPCWAEGLQKMKVGEKAKLTCPAQIAYGDSGKPPKVKPGAAVQFEMELLEILPSIRSPQDHPAPPGSPQADAGGAKADARESAVPPKKP